MSFQVTRGRKKSRNELPLPTLHFVVMDDWVEKLGDKSLLLWLKLFTMCDRQHEYEVDGDVIPTSTGKLIKKLNLTKPTFYSRIAPLYEYGLIDLIEYQSSKNTGNKPVNVIVYDYPQNDYNLAVQPLVKCRDWNKRTEERYCFTKNGGKPTHKEKNEMNQAEYEQWLEEEEQKRQEKHSPIPFYNWLNE